VTRVAVRTRPPHRSVYELSRLGAAARLGQTPLSGLTMRVCESSAIGRRVRPVRRLGQPAHAGSDARSRSVHRCSSANAVRQRQPHRARASSQSSGRNVTESSAFFDRELRAPLELFLDRQARYGCNSAPPSFAETAWPTRVTSPSACVPPRPARPSLAATAFRRPFVYADLCESIPRASRR
jgi:hypothetical protein